VTVASLSPGLAAMTGRFGAAAPFAKASELLGRSGGITLGTKRIERAGKPTGTHCSPSPPGKRPPSWPVRAPRYPTSASAAKLYIAMDDTGALIAPAHTHALVSPRRRRHRHPALPCRESSGRRDESQTVINDQVEWPNPLHQICHTPVGDSEPARRLLTERRPEDTFPELVHEIQFHNMKLAVTKRDWQAVRDTRPGTTTRIQSVSRAAALLLLVAENNTDGSGKALAQAAGLATATAHHLLNTLVDEGLLTKDALARYSLGPRMALLADAFSRDIRLPQYLRQPLERLAEMTGDTSYVAGFRQGEIRILGSVEGTRPVRVSVPLNGPYLNAPARATGKLLLALSGPDVYERYLRAPLLMLTPTTVTDPDKLRKEFASICERGYALDDEEYQLGVKCVSAPVMDGPTAVAAFSVSVPTPRFDSHCDELIEAVLEVSASAKKALTAHPAPCTEQRRKGS